MILNPDQPTPHLGSFRCCSHCMDGCDPPHRHVYPCDTCTAIGRAIAVRNARRKAAERGGGVL